MERYNKFWMGRLSIEKMLIPLNLFSIFFSIPELFLQNGASIISTLRDKRGGVERGRKECLPKE